MKRLLLLIALTMLMGTLCGYAQDKGPGIVKKFYIEITGEVNPINHSISVNLNLGKLLSRRTGLSPADMQRASRDLNFDSMVDAMNLLAANGWTLEQSYVVTSNKKSVIYWVASKSVQNPLELLDGFAPKN